MEKMRNVEYRRASEKYGKAWQIIAAHQHLYARTMLTPEQESWVSHLSNTEKVKIIPFDPRTKSVFNKLKEEIKGFLGNTEIFHCGSTALKISGQGEVDLYIPVSLQYFNDYLDKIVSNFGKPGSLYPLKRARFVKYIEGIKAEIFLINKDGEDWKNLLKFENHLKESKSSRDEYEQLKKESDGLPVQAYYRKKLEFINKILLKL